MIYICTHTDFNLLKEFLELYIILSCKLLENKYTIPVEIITPNKITPMQYSYAEGYHIFHIWQTKCDDWIGINQYRKYFKNVPKYRTVLPIPRKYNMHEQYADSHNINDLLQCERIIDEFFPEYKCDYTKLTLSHCNMFVMRRHDFEEYCKFVFGVLDIFNKLNNLHTDEDVYKFVERRYNQYGQKHNIKYQSRLHGYLFERLSTIFFNTYFSIEYRKITFVDDKIE